MADPIYHAFASIHAEESLKTSTKQFLHQARQRRSRPALPHFRRVCVAVCAVFVLLMGALCFHTVSNTPVSYISIDVNPSIELTLNRWDRVISADARNEDGSAILSTLSVKGMPYTDALDTIIDSDAMQPYLKSNDALTLTVASADERRETILLAGIENCSACRNHGGQSYKADTSLLEVAHEHGLSLGKYAAFLELCRYDANVTPEECRDMTMAQIHNRIKECREAEHASDFQGGNHNAHAGTHDSQGGQHGQGGQDGQGQKGHGQSGGKWGSGD